MAEIIQQLSTLLRREVKQIRKTDETPPRISVIDVVIVITGKNANPYRRRCVHRRVQKLLDL